MAGNSSSTTSDTGDPAPAKNAGQRRKRWKWYALFSSLGFCLLALVVGELVVRAYAARDSYFSICIGAGDEWDGHRTFRLRKNFSIGGVTTNSKGILGPEFNAEKDPNGFRVVTLGDSCSFIPVEKNYPRVLEELLRRTNPGSQIDVINASCPGYRSDQLRTWYEREIDSYQHDLLIIYVGWNDMAFPQLQKTAAIPREPSFLQRQMARCYLLRYLNYRQQLGSRDRPVSLAPLSRDEARDFHAWSYPAYFEQNLLAIVGLARSRNRQVFLLNYATLLDDSPTEDEQARMHFPAWMDRRLPLFLTYVDSHEAALLRVAGATNTPIIDIKSLFQNVEDRRVFTDSTHYDVRGAEMVAARVAETISPYVKQGIHVETDPEPADQP